MATVIRTLLKGYHYLNEEVADPRTKDFFLISSPWPGLMILALYLHFVHKSGPSLMANRRPFKLEKVMQIYNIIQIILCSYLCYQALILGWLKEFKLFCEPINYDSTPRQIQIARTVWLYFIVKMLDLFDTVFFVLRKKQNQVSFLHVYHHTGMAMGGWGATKYLAGGHITGLGLINSFVHMVMYSHYLATSLKLGKPWWKKYITQLQLVQFTLLLFHFMGLLVKQDCAFPRWPAFVFIPQNLFMMVLFGDFYYKTYLKKKPVAKIEQNGVTPAEIANGKAKLQ